jgi:hypothetical protein
MNRKELEAAIVKPAESLGVSFAPGLVHRILEDVTRAPGGLPLLQFALREIWGSQQNGQITSESYDMIGGVDGAVAARAEAVYHKLTALDEQPPNPAKAQVKRDFQRLFTRLVALGEGQVDTRRVVSRDELGTAWALAERLAGEDNRLVVTSALDLPPERRTDDRGETVEIAHEALIRHWPRLVEWIKGDRNFQAWLTQIRPYTNVWLSNPSDSAPLLRGGMLAQAEDWFNSRRDDLSAAERNYVQASLDLRSEEERQRHAEMEAKIGQERALAEAATQLAEAQAVQHEQALKYAETQRAHAEFERQRALAQSFVDRRRSYIAIFAGLLSIIFLSLFAFGGFALKF